MWNTWEKIQHQFVVLYLNEESFIIQVTKLTCTIAF